MALMIETEQIETPDQELDVKLRNVWDQFQIDLKEETMEVKELTLYLRDVDRMLVNNGYETIRQFTSHRDSDDYHITCRKRYQLYQNLQVEVSNPGPESIEAEYLEYLESDEEMSDEYSLVLDGRNEGIGELRR